MAEQIELLQQEWATVSRGTFWKAHLVGHNGSDIREGLKALFNNVFTLNFWAVCPYIHAINVFDKV